MVTSKERTMSENKCLENIRKMPPPYNRPCTTSYCAATLGFLDRYCADTGLPPNTPIICMDPALKNPIDPGYCYCCCDALPTSLPIRAADGGYAFSADLKPGDSIMVAGLDLVWRPTKVVDVHVVPADLPQSDAIELAYKVGGNERRVVVSADTMLLTAERKLMAASELRAGASLAGADGGSIAIDSAAPGSFSGAHATVRVGDDAGGALGDRLVDVAGLVAADYSVQLHHALGGDRIARTHSPIRHAGARPIFKAATVTVAGQMVAYAYLTVDQANDIAVNGQFRPKSVTTPLETARYLEDICRTFFPDINYRVDWETDDPNAYMWHEGGVPVVSLNGGLLRADVLNRDGYAVILCELIAAAEGKLCKGEAAHAATAEVARVIWRAGFYPLIVMPGVEELRKLFDWVSAAHAGPVPGDHCAEPGLACRLQCYEAGVGFLPLPQCAKSVEPLIAKRALATDNSRVAVLFDAAVDPASGGNRSNYQLKPSVTVDGATVDPLDPARVNLTTAPLALGQAYVLTLSSVTGANGGRISPDPTKLNFTGV
jgi:hypothetical protein